VFCPNCGTQNPDAAQNCSKCNFNLKGAAAPKFKGTVLMTPGAAFPGAPQAGPPGMPAAAPAPAAPTAPAAGGAPRPAGALPAMPSKLKGTMVGIAPPMGGTAPAPAAPAATFAPAAPASPFAPAAPASPFAPAAPAAFTPAPAAPAVPSGQSAQPLQPPVPPPAAVPPAPGFDAAAGSFSPSPQAPQPGVNPLGGTIAADQVPFGGFGAPPQAPAQSPYGPPPGVPSPYGPPPSPYGAAPGAPSSAYGAPPGYGQPPPPAQDYGAMQGAQGMAGMPGTAQPQPIAPFGGASPSLAGTLQSVGIGAAVQPTRRNALMWWLVPFALIAGGGVVGSLLTIVLGMISPSLALVGTLLMMLAVLAGAALAILGGIRMVNEVKSVTRNAAFAWWPMFVPIYNMYWMWVLVPQEVAKAKQMLGVQTPVRSIVLYIFLWHFALASDINDMVR
jgi:hypothetical protein